MGWLSIAIWIIAILAVIFIVKKIADARTGNNNYSSQKMSFADSMKAVGKNIGDCCRKLGA